MLTIRPYRPTDAAAFRDLNLLWIRQYFSVETFERDQLDHPDETILATGGRILIADHDGIPVGTTALLRGRGHDTVELAKMSVHPDHQRKGIGTMLMSAAIASAREMGASHIWLETHKRLSAALQLYRSAGFRELSGDELTATPPNRCNCQMMLDL